MTYFKQLRADISGKLDPDFGLDPNSEQAARLRALQISNLSALTPHMMVTNLVCAVLTFIALWDEVNQITLGLWSISLVGLAAVALWYNYKQSDEPAPEFASKRAISKAVMWSGTLALFWGVLAAYFYPQVPVEKHPIIIALICGMMGGGAITLYVVPRVMTLWLFLLGMGCTFGLLLSPSPLNLAVVGLLLIFCTALMKAGLSMAKTYAARSISEFTMAEQADTIGILLRDFSENASDWLWEVDANGDIIRGAGEFEQALKTTLALKDSAGAEAGNAPTYVVPDRHLRALKFHLGSPISFRDLLVCSQKGDEACWVQLSGKPILDDDGNLCGYRGVASDVTERKSAEERIAFLAHNDALTGLVNRGEFSRLLGDKISYGSPDERWSVLYLDLDGFKAVNDQYGHGIGDALLSEVAKRLKSIIGENDVVARLGGDEFAILCNTCGTASSASNVAEQLIKGLSEPYMCQGVRIEVSTSVGICLAQADGNTTFSLLNNADLALYRAKAEGKGTYRFYDREMDDIVKERRNLENDLRVAVRNGELDVFFQPLISSETGKTSGFEALARWNHPVRGLISPSEFIPIAERIGLISEIGEWVLNRACREARDWPSGLTVAVNLSPQQFASGDIVAIVQTAIEENRLDPGRLELEITEGLFMDNTESVMESLSKFKEMGISIAMDDFGTGYSSLSYILKFPFDKLKIDKSFVNSIATDDVSRNVLEAITKLGDMLNLKVTAEGVESQDQAALLEQMSCTHFQGFHFGKPLPATDLPSYLLGEFKQTNGMNASDAADTAKTTEAKAG